MEEKPIGYRLLTLEVLNFFVNAKPKDFKGTEFHFDITAQARVNPEKGIVFVVISIGIREDKQMLGHFESALGFEIENFAEAIPFDKDQNVYMVPLQLEVPLRTIAISTTRGLMYAKLQGTYLQKAILPIIPQLITPEPGETKENKEASE
jgi:hypothetical protein